MNLYLVCGSYALLQRRYEPGEALRAADVARVGSELFEALPEELVRLFPQPLHMEVVEEEVPTGDVAVYLHHLALRSTSNSLANITFLLHPDFLEHVRSWKLGPIFQALLTGSWPDVDFLYLGWRHEGPVRHSRVASHLRYHCDVEPWKGGHIGPCDSGYNPILLQNLWMMAFGRPLEPTEGDDLGGYDFSQLLVTRRAVLQRPAAYWRYLSKQISARSSFQLLPGTGFISRRTDLSVNDPWNKGVCAWFEHLWHMLFDPDFFPTRKPRKPYG